MSLKAGHTLAHYEILELIGKGGMGEVYRARDGKLGRDVAIKVLPDEFAENQERLARFKREAKVLASLNHPNIASIYGLEQSGSTHFLVLELVEGETLAERIARGPIPLTDALAIASKIAEALEAAHEQSIVHRDLKPPNVKLTPDDDVKVLDFGLAKVFVEDQPDADSSMSPTITRNATRVGVILGTAAYMSPEQAKGKKVDKRTDIFAFGAVLYEMLTGKKTFPGDDVSEVLASVIKSEPDWSALPKEIPIALRTLVRRCLAKDRKSRLPDIGVARLEIAESATVPEEAAPPATTERRAVWQRPLPVALTSALVGAVLTLVAVKNATRPAPPGVTRTVVVTEQRVGGRFWGQDVALSPDGKHIVYVSGFGPESQLYVRPINQFDATLLSDGDGPYSPFISPDGNWVGYFSDGNNELKKVSIHGGPSVPVGDAGGSVWGASWGSDDTIVFATGGFIGGGSLWRLSAGGGVPEALASVSADEAERWAYLWPEVLPGGKAILFTISRSQTARPASYEIAALSLETGEQRVLIAGGSNPRYVPTVHIVYGVSGALRAVRFDPTALEVIGDPIPVLQGVATKRYGAANFAIANDGSLVYVPGQASAFATSSSLVWVNREGQEELLGIPADVYTFLDVSPDGTKVALHLRADIWISEPARKTLSKLTTDPAPDFTPLWTPDGRHVVFTSDREGPRGLFMKAADGTGPVERLVTIANLVWLSPHGWSPDGNRLVFEYRLADRDGHDIGLLSMEGEREWEPLFQSEASERNPAISPDGQWVAYASDQTGRFEVYVERFPMLGERRPVSAGGGTEPLWSPDGHELLYRSGDAIMSVLVRTEPDLALETPEVLFEGQYRGGATAGQYWDITPDGQRFVMMKDATPDGDSERNQIYVVLNWFDELERLVPAGN